MVGAADLHRALEAAWAATTLAATFTAYWPAGASSHHVPFNEGADDAASPGCPMPHCTYTLGPSSPVARMSATGRGRKLELRRHPLQLQVYARQTAEHTAKELAATLATAAMAWLGGHPNIEPTAHLRLEYGRVVQIGYTGDHGVQVDDLVYRWTIDYSITADVPIQVHP